MILQSLITDASSLSLDCARTKFVKDTILELPDNLYWEKEIQNAIKLNMIRLVGDPPEARPAAQEERQEQKIKLICNSRVQGKIAFDCIRESIQAGDALLVPESKMNHPEIQNALNCGILEDPENQIEVPDTSVHRPVELDEVRITEEEATSPTPSRPSTTASRRRTRARPRQATSSIRARRITRTGEANNIEDNVGDIVGGESQIIVPQDGSFNTIREQSQDRNNSIELPMEEAETEDALPNERSMPETLLVKKPEVIETSKEPEKVKSDAPFSFLDIFGE